MAADGKAGRQGISNRSIDRKLIEQFPLWEMFADLTRLKEM